jgi:hypothetical protein
MSILKDGHVWTDEQPDSCPQPVTVVP